MIVRNTCYVYIPQTQPPIPPTTPWRQDRAVLRLAARSVTYFSKVLLEGRTNAPPQAIYFRIFQEISTQGITITGNMRYSSGGRRERIKVIHSSRQGNLLDPE